MIQLGARPRMVDKASAMTLRRRISERLSALGLSMRAASIRAGLGTHFLRDLMADEAQSPKADNLSKLALALETTPEWLVEERGDETLRGIPIMGYVGAGAHYKPYEDQGALDFADAPPHSSGVLGAARVRGHSQHPVYRDGDVIYFGAGRDDVDEFVGEDVIAELDDGSMILKVLESGADGLFTLSSHNAPAIKGACVLRVAPIRWIDRKPRRK